MLRFYNTLARKKEGFKPIKSGFVSVYTCGPTVYDYAHIGNLRAYVFQDLLRRYLKYKGLRVKQVMNITDVDDKTIRNSRKQKTPLKEYTEKYKKAFFEDVKTLNIEHVEIYPEATKHIKEMVKLVVLLLRKGLAYKGSDGSVYYDISKFRDYGKLSHLDLKSLKVGARVRHDEYDKEHASDFVLWKAWNKDDGDVFWETELGKGRPGWHLECSAMSTKYLGKTFDIHMGGVDLIFPHHENEIAQSEGVTGKKFVNCWVHNEHLLVNGKKMSKSLGNFYTLRDLLKKGYEPKAIRFLLLSTHYRQILDFTFKGLESASNAIDKIIEFIGNLESVKGGNYNKRISNLVKKTKKEFGLAMDDDLNVPLALSHIFDFIKEVNKVISSGKLSKKNTEEAKDLILGFDSILGLELGRVKIEWCDLNKAGKELRELIEKREAYRRGKNFKKADEIRSRLRKQGIILEDTERGIRWRKTLTGNN